MIIKCPNCNGALEYHIEQGLLYCKFCGAFLTSEEAGVPEIEGNADKSEESEIDQEILAATTELNERFMGHTDNPTERKIVKFDSMGDIFSGATKARKNGTTGNFIYDLPPEQKELNRNRFYKQQKKLHESFSRHRTDYTKAFSGTSLENLTAEEVEKLRLREWEAERQRKEAEETGSAYTDTATQEKGEAVRSQNLHNYTNYFGATVPGTAPKKKKRAIYTASGARVIRDVGGVLLTTDTPLDEEAETIDNKIYSCTSCGAELALTDTEISSFCSYCGQPTIVFDRMEKTEMPDSIIPFVITKEEALKKVQRRLNKGLLIPKEVKRFEVERLRGIYIPYWLFDASYDDSMVIKSKAKYGKGPGTIKYFRVNTHCNLFYYPVDASKNLNDQASRKLEPYDYSGLRPFKIAYMSGFYSDRFDMSSETMMTIAMYRAQSQMAELASSKISGTVQGIVEGTPMFHVKKKYYIMLPAWFMTFRYEDKPYTIMVNGQSGKVVGAVPFSKKKFYGLMAGISVLCCIITVPLGMYLVPIIYGSFGPLNLIFFVLIALVILFFLGLGNIRKYKQNIELTAEDDIMNYVRERQDATP